MNKQILWIPLILIALFATAADSRAQTAHGLQANVPFDFVVGDKTIPAGHIRANGVSATGQGSLSIANSAQGKVAFRIGRRVLGTQRATEAKMVFHKLGNRYFLAEISVPGYETWRLMKSKEEKSLERDNRLVKNFKPEQVTVAATLD